MQKFLINNQKDMFPPMINTLFLQREIETRMHH